jgi:hypothetical protein
VALLLSVGTGPNAVVDGFGSPLDEWLSPERRALQAPVDPGVVAAAFGHRRNPGVLLARSSGGVAFAWCADGGAEAGSQDGTSTWQGVKPGEGRRALGVWRHGVVEGVDGWQGDAELADQSLNQEGRGSDNARIGAPWGGALDGLEALVDAVGGAPRMGAAEALEGGAARQLGGLEGRPVGEEVAEEGGGLVVEPGEDMRAVVRQGTGQAIREAHVVADQTAAMFDQWFEGTHRGALGLEGLELVAMRAQELTREFRVRGIVLGVAGREGFAVLGQGQRIAGAQAEDRVWPQGVDERACSEVAAHRHRASCTPLWYGPCPRIDGRWCVCESTALPGVRADGL